MNVDKKYKLNKAITSKEYIKPPKQKGKKVECKNCLYFKFGYYCDKLKKTAPNYYKKKACKYYKGVKK